MYKCYCTYKSVFSRSAVVLFCAAFMWRESAAGRTRPPERRPGKKQQRKVFFGRFSVLCLWSLMAAAGGDWYLVCLAVTGHPLRDRRSSWGLVQVGAVVVQQQLVTQRLQLWNRMVIELYEKELRWKTLSRFMLKIWSHEGEDTRTHSWSSTQHEDHKRL